MSEIVFSCSSCGNSVISDDTLCGELAKCPECESEVVVPIPGLVADMKLGDFKLQKRLGNGSMGEVWLAHQESMDRRVALKVLAPKLSSDVKFIERFSKEAKNSAKLAHPNIVTAFYSGFEKGIYYLAISYVSGETIDCKLERDGLFDEKQALEITLAMAEALEYAWDEERILHRDIKPANIIINNKGIPMLLDMGISKSMNEENDLTMTGTVIGTPYYMSPEQALAEKDIDFRTDIYSLGTTLYHMVTGTVPYNATTAMAIIMKHMSEELPHPQDRNPDLSDHCATLIESMMAKDRKDRQQSWVSLQKDIKLVLQGKAPTTPSPTAGMSDEERAVAETVIKAQTNVHQEAGKKPVLNPLKAETHRPDSAETVDSSKEPAHTPKKKSKTLLIIIILVVLFFLLGFILLLAGFGVYLFASEGPVTPYRIPEENVVTPDPDDPGIIPKVYEDPLNKDPDKDSDKDPIIEDPGIIPKVHETPLKKDAKIDPSKETGPSW